MTGAVKFGTITGRIDMQVEGLEMENWQPLSFNARVATSPGEHGFQKRVVIKRGGKPIKGLPLSDNYAVSAAEKGEVADFPQAALRALHAAFPKCVFTWFA